MKKYDIHQQILNVAETLIQTKGYNAFSYKDISELVGVKTSSIHYYFPAKEDLGKEVVKQHIDLLVNELEELLGNSLSALGRVTYKNAKRGFRHREKFEDPGSFGMGG